VPGTVGNKKQGVIDVNQGGRGGLSAADHYTRKNDKGVKKRRDCYGRVKGERTRGVRRGGEKWRRGGYWKRLEQKQRLVGGRKPSFDRFRIYVGRSQVLGGKN